MFVPILLLSLLGASSAHVFFYGPPADNSQTIVENFLVKMVKTIETKDVAKISDLFTDNFFFHGCKGDYDKKKIVAMLSNIPSGTRYAVAFKSSKLISGDKIESSVSIAGFNPVPVEARFIINAGKLEGGSVPACPKAHFHGFISPVSDEAQGLVEEERPKIVKIVNSFMTRMNQSIVSKDRTMIAGLIHPAFTFRGCGKTYNKPNFVDLLYNLPVGSKFNADLKMVWKIGGNIDFVVAVSGLDEHVVFFEFSLTVAHQLLKSGRTKICEEPRHFAIAQDTAQVTMEKFLTRMIKTVETHDKSLILGLFEPDFSFKGCKATYNREQAVALLMFIPRGTQFSYKIKSVEDNGGSINCVLLATGLANTDVEFDFILNKKDQQLESAVMPVCPLPRRFANSDDGSSVFHGLVGQEPRPFALAQDNAQATIEEFLAQMIKTVETHDKSLILGLFEPTFSFKGCKATYNREQAVALLMFIPRGTEFSYKIKSVEDNGESINCVLLATGLTQHDVEFDFVLNKKDQQLESAVMPVCPIRRRFARSAPEDSNAVTQRFLAHFKEVITAFDFDDKDIIRKYRAIGVLFDDNFLFKGCKGTYNKKIAKIMTSALEDFRIQFNVKSSKWIQNGQIDFTVNITGAFDTFDIQAVFSPQRNVFISGSLLNCPNWFILI